MRYLPVPPPDKLKTCPRCQLVSPADAEQCSHCSNLSDRELAEYLEHYQAQLEAGSNLGRYFLFGAGIVLVVMVISALSH